MAPLSTSTAVPASPPSAPSALTAEVETAFRRASPETFFVAARVLRRVLRNDLEISSPLIKLPHQKTYVIDRDRLLWLVARDELGAAPNAVLPARLILIARPEGELAARFDSRGLWRYYWRLNYHARIDFQMRDATAPLRMSTAMLRQRINRIG